MLSKRSRRRAAPFAVALFCAVLTVGLTFAMVSRGRVDATAVPVYTLPPQPAPPRPLTLPPSPSVLLMGDSYSQGYGAEPETEGYAYHIAQPLGWRLVRDGVAGTGYVNPGPKNQGSYPTRLLRHQPTESYDLVVLQGGTNDEKQSSGAVTEGIDATVSLVKQRYPGAQLLVVGPIAPFGNPTADAARVNVALAEYTHDHSILFVNAVAEHWFQPGESQTMVNQKNGHPNNVGYQRIAERFIDAVHRVGRPVA